MSTYKPKPLGGIYVIRVKGYGNYYGESNNIYRRWATHRRHLAKGRHTNFRLKAAYKAIGIKGFFFEILEQSEELTNNKILRQYREKLYILNDPLALNVASGPDVPVTELTLPNRDVYRNKIVKLRRKARSSLVEIRDAATDTLIGVESIEGKFRLGTFRSDRNCILTRLSTRNTHGATTNSRRTSTQRTRTRTDRPKRLSDGSNYQTGRSVVTDIAGMVKEANQHKRDSGK